MSNIFNNGSTAPLGPIKTDADQLPRSSSASSRHLSLSGRHISLTPPLISETVKTIAQQTLDSTLQRSISVPTTSSEKSQLMAQTTPKTSGKISVVAIRTLSAPTTFSTSPQTGGQTDPNKLLASRAKVIELLPLETASINFQQLPQKEQTEVLRKLSKERACDILIQLPSEKRVALLKESYGDILSTLFHRLPKEEQDALSIVYFKQLPQKTKNQVFNQLSTEKQLKTLALLTSQERNGLLSSLPFEKFEKIYDQLPITEKVAVLKAISPHFFSEVLKKLSLQDQELILNETSIPILTRVKGFMALEGKERLELFTKLPSALQKELITRNLKECSSALLKLEKKNQDILIQSLPKTEHASIENGLKQQTLIEDVLSLSPMNRKPKLDQLSPQELGDMMKWASRAEQLAILQELPPAAIARCVGEIVEQSREIVAQLHIPIKEKIEVRQLLIQREEILIDAAKKKLDSLHLSTKKFKGDTDADLSRPELILKWQQNVEGGMKNSLIPDLTLLSSEDIAKFLKENGLATLRNFIKEKHPNLSLEALKTANFGLTPKQHKDVLKQFFSQMESGTLYDLFTEYVGKFYLEISSRIGIMDAYYGVFKPPNCSLDMREFYTTLLTESESDVRTFYTGYNMWTNNLSSQAVKSRINSFNSNLALMQSLIMPTQPMVPDTLNLESATQMLEITLAMANQKIATITDKISILHSAYELLETLKTLKSPQENINAFTTLIQELQATIPPLTLEETNALLAIPANGVIYSATTPATIRSAIAKQLCSLLHAPSTNEKSRDRDILFMNSVLQRLEQSEQFTTSLKNPADPFNALYATYRKTYGEIATESPQEKLLYSKLSTAYETIKNKLTALSGKKPTESESDIFQYCSQVFEAVRQKIPSDASPFFQQTLNGIKTELSQYATKSSSLILDTQQKILKEKFLNTPSTITENEADNIAAILEKTILKARYSSNKNDQLAVESLVTTLLDSLKLAPLLIQVVTTVAKNSPLFFESCKIAFPDLSQTFQVLGTIANHPLSPEIQTTYLEGMAAIQNPTDPYSYHNAIVNLENLKEKLKTEAQEKTNFPLLQPMIKRIDIQLEELQKRPNTPGFMALTEEERALQRLLLNDQKHIKLEQAEKIAVMISKEMARTIYIPATHAKVADVARTVKLLQAIVTCQPAIGVAIRNQIGIFAPTLYAKFAADGYMPPGSPKTILGIAGK